MRAAKVAGRAYAWALAIPAIPWAVTGQASAQERPVDIPETVVESLRPQGIRLGSFIAYPRLNANMRYDTNIYNRAEPTGDVVAVVRPAVRLASDFARHSLQFDVAAEGRRYFENPAENNEQWAARVDGTLDLANRFTLSPSVGFAQRIERRGTAGDQFRTDEPVSFQEADFGLRLGRMGGILEWQATVGTRKLTYDDATIDGAPLDQSFRNVSRDQASFRVDYHRFARFSLFGRVTGTRLRYDEGAQRNSKGFSIIGGVSYQVTDLIQVEAGLGYVTQESNNPSSPDLNALDYSLRGSWTPTPRVRVEVAGGRSIERGPLPAVSTVLESTVDATVTVALGERTLLGVQAGYVRDDYRGIDRRDTRYFAEATARYLITPHISALVGVGGRKQTAFGFGSREYDGATVRAGISLAL